jgi:hypothetical protein
LYVLEEVGRPAVLHDLCVFLDGIHSELQELLLVREENGSGCLLVVTAVAGIEDLNPKFALLVGLPGSDCEAGSRREYPEAPVPKSMAMTCVKSLSSLSRAIFKFIR